MRVEPKIQNRRFAVLYFLNKAFTNKNYLSLKSLVDFMLKHEDLFIIERSKTYETMCEEINIASFWHTIYNKDNDKLYPLTGINISELALNAPLELIETLNEYKL